jgi:hypothetical protein
MDRWIQYSTYGVQYEVPPYSVQQRDSSAPCFAWSSRASLTGRRFETLVRTVVSACGEERVGAEKAQHSGPLLMLGISRTAETMRWWCEFSTTLSAPLHMMVCENNTKSAFSLRANSKTSFAAPPQHTMPTSELMTTSEKH